MPSRAEFFADIFEACGERAGDYLAFCAADEIEAAFLLDARKTKA